MSEDDSTVVWVGNLDDRVSEELIYELFLQAGPVEYVRQPKDKASGKKKTFAFVGYKHDCSVPYAISLMNSIKLFGRNIRVQSRYLQNLQAQGIALDSQGIHTLDPFERDNSNGGQEMSHMKRSGSLLGEPPAVNIPPHILALAQQQMSMLNAQGMVPLSQNPALNARMRPRNDSYGSINYNYGQDSHSGRRYDHYQNHRGRSRSFDNKTMQSLKMNIDAATAQNSQMLASVQEQQGHFDRNRIGHSHSNYNEDRYERDNRYDNRHHRNQESHHKNSRDYRQQPYDRHEGHHSRHDRHASSDNRSKFGRSHSYTNDRFKRGGGHQSHYSSRR